MDTLVLATGNPHKVAELRALLAPSRLRIVGLDEAAHRLGRALTEPEETGATFEANASLKALAYARATGLACLADDSGLEVDALSGRPGVISSHYAFEGRTDGPAAGMTRAQRDEANNARLLREMEGVAEPDRAARFVCVMALAAFNAGAGAGREPAIVALTRGRFEGRIGRPPRVPSGDRGFGYDPLFLVAPGFEQTSAELSPAEKNARSHRALAAKQMLEWLTAHAAAAPSGGGR